MPGTLYNYSVYILGLGGLSSATEKPEIVSEYLLFRGPSLKE